MQRTPGSPARLHAAPSLRTCRALRCSRIGLSRWAAGCASLPDNVERPVSTAFDAPRADAARPAGAAAHGAGRQARSDSGFRLLDSVGAAFSSRLALIESAQRSLDLQYYAIHADASTEVAAAGACAMPRGAACGCASCSTTSTRVGQGRPGAAPGLRAQRRDAVVQSRCPARAPRLIGRLFTSLQRRAAHPEAHAQQAVHRRQRHGHHRRPQPRATPISAPTRSSNFVDLDVLAVGPHRAGHVRQLRPLLERRAGLPGAVAGVGQGTGRVAQATRPMRPSPTPIATARRRSGPPPQRVRAGDRWTCARHPSGPRRRTADRRARSRRTRSAHGPAPASPLVVGAGAAAWRTSPARSARGDDEADAGDTVVDGLLQLIGQARQDVLIISPYFVPGAPMMKQAFARMRAQGRAHPRADEFAGLQRCAGRPRRLCALSRGPAGAGHRAVRNALPTRRAPSAAWAPPPGSAPAAAGGSKSGIVARQPAFQGA